MVNITLGEFISEIMKLKDLSATDVANLTGVSKTTIYSIVKNKCKVSDKTKLEILRKLGFPDTIEGRVKYMRKIRAMNTQRLAEKAGIGVATVYRVEKGETQDMMVTTLTGLADALGMPEILLLRESKKF